MLAVAVLAACVTVSYPNATGETIDVADLMTPGPGYLDATHMMPGVMAGHAFYDKIVYTKFGLDGKYWDAWRFDDDYIYALSEGTSTDFTYFAQGQPELPRYARTGFPGTRLVLDVGSCNTWQSVASCVVSDVFPGAPVVTEVWGPYDLETRLGVVPVIEMRNYWNCTKTATASCSVMERYLYSKPYGWIGWYGTLNPGLDGNFVPDVGGMFDIVTPGGSGLQDWCGATPSIFAVPRHDPPGRVPVTR